MEQRQHRHPEEKSQPVCPLTRDTPAHPPHRLPKKKKMFIAFQASCISRCFFSAGTLCIIITHAVPFVDAISCGPSSFPRSTVHGYISTPSFPPFAVSPARSASRDTRGSTCRPRSPPEHARRNRSPSVSRARNTITTCCKRTCTKHDPKLATIQSSLAHNRRKRKHHGLDKSTAS